MSSPTAPLKRIAQINRVALPEDTDPDRDIRYIDISAVGRGSLVTEPLLMRFGDAPSRARRLVATGDTIVSTVRTYLRAVSPISGDTEDLVVSTGFAVMSPGERMHYGFLSWFLQSDPFIEEVVARSNGVSYPAINASDLGTIDIRVPPATEQRAIADFLDAETARIDALITKKRRLIEVLDEHLGVAIDCVVSSSPNEQPAPLMHLVDQRRPIMYGIVLPGPDVDEGVPIVKGGDVKEHRLNLDSVCRTTREIEAAYERSRLLEDDLVFAIRGSVGEVERVPAELAGANITQDVARIAPAPGVNLRWLMYALRAPTTQAYVASRVTGATIRGINIWELDRVRVPVPSQGDQARRAEALDLVTRRHAHLTAGLTRQIELLAEHRQALITAAATGEFDIAEAVA